jgi:hypothetical protein
MIDPRGQRFAAWITSVVLAVVLVTGNGWLLLAQAIVFALGAGGRSPYAAIWKLIPKSPLTELEDKRPPQFAQAVGLGFAVIGVLGYLSWTPLGTIATAAALAAAFLNAAFGFCLGCEIYLFVKRTTNKGVTA